MRGEARLARVRLVEHEAIRIVVSAQHVETQVLRLFPRVQVVVGGQGDELVDGFWLHVDVHDYDVHARRLTLVGPGATNKRKTGRALALPVSLGRHWALVCLPEGSAPSV